MTANKKRKIGNVPIIVFIAVILSVYSLIMIGILVWGFLTSLKSQMDFLTLGNVVGLPNAKYSADELKFKNYLTILQNFKFSKYFSFYSGEKLIAHRTQNNIAGIFMNTILYAFVGSAIQAVTPAIMAYLMVQYPGKASSFINGMCLFTMTLPIVGNQGAMLNLMRNLGLYDTFIGNFIQKFHFGGMYFFVFQAFFRSVSTSFAEAAEIDGASQFRIMFEIYIPLAGKMIATVVLILFVNCWNDYQTPLLYLPTKPTLAYAVYYLTYENNQPQMATLPVKVAACMILVLPILLIFIFLKDKLMGNISLGGEKE